MGDDLRGPVRASDAIARGELSRHQRRSRFGTVFHNVAAAKGAHLTAAEKARAAWLWSSERGVLVGRSAAAVHGSYWIDPTLPAELVHSNRHAPSGLVLRADRLAGDEICLVDGMRVSTPPRTAFDLARRLPQVDAVAAVDALARATGLQLGDVARILDRYPKFRGVRRAEQVMELVDAGAQSPKESWLRIVLIRAGFPRPQTQIPVRDESGSLVAYLDMGWAGLKVAVEYDGDQHRSDRLQYVKDVRRIEMLESMGWIIVRVNAEDHPNFIIERVTRAFSRRVGASSVSASA